jgi:hypothetical protein
MLFQNEYLNRALPRVFEAQHTELKRAVDTLRAQLASKGRYHSGAHLVSVKQEYERNLKDAATKAARLAFDCAGMLGADPYGNHLQLFRARLEEDLSTYLQKNESWAHGAISQIADEFHTFSVGLTDGHIDDFRHGILDGTKLTRDAVTNVTNAIINSPGAIQQSGTGNVQHAAVSIGSSNEIRAAIEAIRSAPELEPLSPADRQSIFDLSEVIVDELSRPAPNIPKVERFGNILLRLLGELGVQVAASGLSKALFG